MSVCVCVCEGDGEHGAVKVGQITPQQAINNGRGFQYLLYHFQNVNLKLCT